MVNSLTALHPAREDYFKTHEGRIVKLQSVVRGWLLRCEIAPERNFLKSINFSNLEEYEQAEGSEVYFLDKFVIKTRTNCREDYAAYHEAKTLCKKEGLNLLAVPSCRVYKNHIIEDRLPLTPSFKEQIGLYIENAHTFNTAVVQFITFYFQSKLYDIVGGSAHPYQVSTNARIPRYDNICFFIEKGMGKIALVDLEKFQIYKDWYTRDLDVCLNELITLFPYHFDLIISEFKERFPGYAVPIGQCKDLQNQILAYFDAVYFQHKSFTLSKGVTLKTPKSGQISLTPKELAEIANKTGKTEDKVLSTVLLLNRGISCIQPCQAWAELLSKRSLILDHDKVDIQILKELRDRKHIAYYASYGAVAIHL